jgi:nitrous-oxide reductase
MFASWKRWAVPAAALAVAIAAFGQGCGTTGGTPGGKMAKNAAERVYVAPGEHDKYYAFLSGGHSGQVFVYGLPSCRYLKTIPVFAPEPAFGWGYDEHSKQIMKNITWGDAHHPSLSETNGDYDGRWLFINDMPNARIARINLTTFMTDEIFGPIPNVSAAHACPFVTENTEYCFAASRFSAPLPPTRDAAISDYAKEFSGVIAGIKIDPKSGHMSLGFEILMPPFDYDLADAGKGPSHDWAFFTCYNSEEAYDSLEVKASQNDMDFVAAVNWTLADQAVKDGKGRKIGDADCVLDPREIPGLVYFIPTPKSPHGVDVDPSGQYIIAAGKLASVVTVTDFGKLQAAIAAKAFDREIQGIPVIKTDQVRVAEVPVGLGPLHTQFDGTGNAYTSLFLDSQVAKWSLKTWKVIDKIDVYYSIGHLAASEGDTRHPTGEYLLALDKLSKDRYLPMGPSHPEAAQLIDIGTPEMQLLYDFPTYPEPHYGQIIRADKIKTIPIFPLADNHDPGAIKSQEEARVERHGRRVDAYLSVIRSHFTPDHVEVDQGDTVYFHVTNLEQDEDITHGFGILWSSLDMQIEPGETKTIRYVANRPGIVPFYCSNFCSALHQEMQAYMRVRPRG